MSRRIRAVRQAVSASAAPGADRRRRGAAALRLVLGEATGALRTGYSGWVGLRFTAAAPFTVTALSRWGLVSNTGSHEVKLWTDLGVELAAATADCSSLAADGWVDVAITPVTLPAGSYRLGSSETDGGDQWHDSAAYSLAAGMTLEASIYGTPYPFDSSPAYLGQAFVPVSMQFRP